jgi:acetyl esterase/lipase
MANVISSPSYAKVMGISPAVEKSQLRGVVLHCGLYDPHHLDFDGAFGSFLATAGWSYFGFRQFLSDPRLEQFSVVRNVTADFPPMFISVGNGDGLAAHSYLLAEIAKRQGVSVDSLFFPTDYMPALPHQYQFNLDTEAGRTALERSVAFIARRSR